MINSEAMPKELIISIELSDKFFAKERFIDELLRLRDSNIIEDYRIVSEFKKISMGEEDGQHDYD